VLHHYLVYLEDLLVLEDLAVLVDLAVLEDHEDLLNLEGLAAQFHLFVLLLLLNLEDLGFLALLYSL